MEYLPTLTPKVIQNNPNVGKYSIHGSLGHEYHGDFPWFFVAFPRYKFPAISLWEFQA